MGISLLDQGQGKSSPHRQTAGIRLSYTLACLRGFEYQLPRLGRSPVPAAAFIDTYDHVLSPDAPLTSLTGPRGDCPLDAVLASGANEMGFPPYLLSRARQWPIYLEDGIVNLPPGPARLHLLIHPHPAAAIHDLSWAKPDVQPTFAQTAVRGLNLQRSQSIYDDLKRLEKTNTHIAWIDRLGDGLGPVLDQLPAETKEAVTSALRDAIADMAREADVLRGQRSGAVNEGAPGSGPEPAGDSGPGELLSRALRMASGLAGKQAARVDVISPLLLLPESGATSIDQILSGEVLFHFGGFLDEKMRRNDFDLGYRSTLKWLEDGGLTDAGLAAELNEQAKAAAQNSYSPQEGWKQTGRTTTASLLAMHPWQAARLAGRVTHVLLHDILHHPRP